MIIITSIFQKAAPALLYILFLCLFADFNPIMAQPRLQFSQKDCISSETWLVEFDHEGNLHGRGIPVEHDLFEGAVYQPSSEHFFEIDSAWEWFAGTRMFNFWLHRGLTHIQRGIVQKATIFPGIQFICDGYPPSVSIGNKKSASWDSLHLRIRGSYRQISGDCRRPTWEPERWNSDSVIQFCNNCYSYSVNQMINIFGGYPSGSQPGYSFYWVRDSCRSAGGSREYCNDTLAPDPVLPADYIARAEADGLVFLGANFPGNDFDCADAGVPGGHLVFLAEQPPELEGDYHWYRLDANTGTWSHKPGSLNARNIDDRGIIITNPLNCNRGNYTIARGFFCACGQNSRIR